MGEGVECRGDGKRGRGSKDCSTVIFVVAY